MDTPKMTPTELLAARHLAAGSGRKTREAAGLSLRDMAALVGIDPASLYRWETGATVPRREAALRWRQVVNEIEAYLSLPQVAAIATALTP